MQTLESRLARIREAGKDKAPQDVLELMHRATEELVESGAHNGAIGEGDRAPDFELPDSDGNSVALADLLASGPAILVFFRGHW